MKKLLLILLCVPLLFSCGEETDNLQRELTYEMMNDGYTGKGTYTYGPGLDIYYVGEWKDGKEHGKGTNIFYNGDKYEGEWKNGKRDGQGTYTWKYVLNEGTYICCDVEKYVGEFKNGKIHGQGTYTYADGTIEEGLWENGEFIGKQEKSIWTCETCGETQYTSSRSYPNYADGKCWTVDSSDYFFKDGICKDCCREKIEDLKKMREHQKQLDRLGL